MYRIFLTIITILCLITGGHLMSIPVFGTKRYHRTPSITGSPVTSSASSSNIPYYNQLSTYYDNQPISATYGISGSTIPMQATNLNSINNNYQNGYLTENGYYYYPRHEYHSYGMPTYHGEYKPTPYYYAPAPHYSYYDDRDIVSNPMDDLHEEILHEDERERQQRELEQQQQQQQQPSIPSYGQESWYQTHNNRQQQDELTNNFLKNLIEYNRQIDAQQKLQQQQQDELMQRDQEHKLQLQQYQQHMQQQQQQQLHQQQPYNDEYDEYVELGDYEYEPQTNENIYDMKKYERLDNSQPNYQTMQQQQQQPNVYNPQQQQKQLKNLSKQQQQQQQKQHYENDDEDVRQLKSLAHHSNVQKISSNTKTPKFQNKPYKMNDEISLEDDNIDTDDNFNHYSTNNWNHQQLQKEQPIPSVKSYAQYDNEPEEYDDDAWISWDRKRSSNNSPLSIDPIKNKWQKSFKKIESIKAFNNRKPLIVKVKDFKEKTITNGDGKTTKIETSTKISSPTATITTIKNDLTTKNQPKINEKLLTAGQKEIVIPRPAAINNQQQANLFKGFNIYGTKNTQLKQFDPLNLMKQEDDGDDIKNDKSNDKENNGNNLKDDQKRNGKENVYDTIKQLLAMEQQLEKTPLASKVQKRFVTNEEILVTELNNLKHTSI